MASSASSKKIVILFDMLSSPPVDHDYSDFLENDDFKSERAVFRAIQHLGLEPILLGVFDDLDRLFQDLKKIDPILIFNMTESFRGRRDLSAQIAGALDLLGIPYTGTKALGLSLCQDKGLSKKILAHHRIRVPRWVTSKFQSPIRSLKNFSYPAFVKPIREEASEGISRDSLVDNEKDALDRVAFLHSRYESDVMIEEFIPGREFYVSVMGARRLQVLPIRELCFREFPEDAPKFATFKAKWDDDYRKRWGIRNEFARGLSEEQIDSIQKLVKKSFEFLHLGSYARFDLRLSESGEIVILEANPNPSLSPEDDFPLSAQKLGFKYDEMVAKIVDLA